MISNVATRSNQALHRRRGVDDRVAAAGEA